MFWIKRAAESTSLMNKPLDCKSFTSSIGVLYVLLNGLFVFIITGCFQIKKKRPAHLSIVERLGGF